jgi:hypothetical protein
MLKSEVVVGPVAETVAPGSAMSQGRSAAESCCVLGGLSGGEPAGDAQQRRAIGEGVFAGQERSVWVPITRSHHATCAYSWMRPPSRSRRSGRTVASEGGGVPPSGGRCFEGSVWSVRVEVLHILAQHEIEVAWPGDQDVVEAFPAQRADESFRDRVRPWRPDRVRMMRMSAPAKTPSKAVVNLLSRSRIRNRNRSARSPRFMSRLRACWVAQVPVGWGGDPGEVHVAAVVLDHEQDVETAQEDGVDVGEVDGEDGVPDRNWRQVGPDRLGAGSSPASFMIFQTVEGATVWPRPTSSP